jgi:hypothetical protein
MNRDDNKSDIFHLISVAYKNVGDYDKAEVYCKKSLTLK